MLWDMLERGDLDAALGQHASTRERMATREEYMSLIARHCPPGGIICDAACGLDIQMTCVDVINAWARRESWDVKAEGADLLGRAELPKSDLTLFMKLLPVLDAQRAGDGMRLLSLSSSPRVIVGFPTRTLGGRGVGMERNYGERFESALPGEFEICERMATGNELFYALRRV